MIGGKKGWDWNFFGVGRGWYHRFHGSGGEEEVEENEEEKGGNSVLLFDRSLKSALEYSRDKIRSAVAGAGSTDNRVYIDRKGVFGGGGGG